MLLNFTIENWMSFSGPISFPLVDPSEKVQQLSTICGATASGKTALIKGMSFARDKIVEYRNRRVTCPNISRHEKPTKFSFVVALGESTYRYSFSIKDALILEEKLEIISGQGFTLFHRISGDSDPHFNLSGVSEVMKGNLMFAFQHTSDTSLYLSTASEQGVPLYMNLYTWFEGSLVFQFTENPYSLHTVSAGQLGNVTSKVSEALSQSDVGITSLTLAPVGTDEIYLGDDLLTNLLHDLEEGESSLVLGKSGGYVFTRRSYQVTADKLVTHRLKEDGGDFEAGLSFESAGTIKLISLLISLSDLTSNTPKTYVIDDLDQGIHPNLVAALVGNLTLAHRSQLIYSSVCPDIYSECDNVWLWRGLTN
jgi:AAA15 family ATPase/GTPase